MTKVHASASENSESPQSSLAIACTGMPRRLDDHGQMSKGTRTDLLERQGLCHRGAVSVHRCFEPWLPWRNRKVVQKLLVSWSALGVCRAEEKGSRVLLGGQGSDACSSEDRLQGAIAVDFDNVFFLGLVADFVGMICASVRL